MKDPSPPYVHTTELRDEAGKVLATHDDHWGETITYMSAYTFEYGEYLSLSLMRRDGCSESLWGIPNAFDGVHPLVIECCD